MMATSSFSSRQRPPPPFTSGSSSRPVYGFSPPTWKPPIPSASTVRPPPPPAAPASPGPYALPSLRRIAREAAKTPSPRLVFAFGTSHPEAIFFATHERYFCTPGTLPPKLQSRLDSGEIPLGTLRLVSLGPSESFVVVSGNDAWWDLSGLDSRDRAAVEKILRDLNESRTPLGINGIIQASFGIRGEFVLVYGNGSELFSSDFPSPSSNGEFEERLQRLPKGNNVISCSLAPGGSYFLLGSTSAMWWTQWTEWTQWPTRELEEEMRDKETKLPILRLYTSVVHHAYFYSVRTDGSKVETRYCLPPDVHSVLHQWITELGPATFF